MEIYSGAFKPDGEFHRPETGFHDWVRSDGSTKYKPEPNRYHLYVSLACPWSHRAIILRSLRKLQNVIGMSVTNPIWNENGWWFGDEPGAVPDDVNHVRDVVELYRKVNPKFDEEETVPILWDKKTNTIVNNESREIMRMFDIEFREFGDKNVCLCPPELEKQIDETITKIYTPINNGVYQAGFARNQRPYERACKRLFESLDEWENILSKQRYICGDRLTEADVAFFVTAARFDLVYYSHFKCNIRHFSSYPNLWAWARDIYQTPGVAETCNFEHIKRHYYGSQKMINPYGIIPLGPTVDFTAPHGRG